jgi:hypothetical protein
VTAVSDLLDGLEAAHVADRFDGEECAGCRENCYYCEGEHPWPCSVVDLVRGVRAVLALADSLDVDSCDPMPDERSRLLYDTAERIRAAVSSALGVAVVTAPVPAPDRDRETRQAEAREEIARAIWQATMGEGSGLAWDDRRVSDLYRNRYRRYADAVLALPALRAVRESDALRRDLAALAEEWAASGAALRERANTEHSPILLGAGKERQVAADRIRRLLDGGEGGR